MKNTARAFVVSLTAVLILSGCVRIQMDVTLNEDDTASGTYLFAIQEGLGEELGATDDDAVSQLFGDTSEQFPGSTAEEYKQDGFVGTRVTFEDQSFADLDFDTDELSIVRDGDEYVLEGVIDLGEGAEATDPSTLPASAEMTFSLTFPGAIADSNGTVEGNTVTWNLLDAPDELYARGSANADGGFPVWIWFVIGLVVVIATGGAATAVVISRNKNKTADAGDQPFGEPLAAPLGAPQAPAASAPPAPSAFEPPPVATTDPTTDATVQLPVVDSPESGTTDETDKRQD